MRAMFLLALGAGLALSGCTTCYHRTDHVTGNFQDDLRDCEAQQKAQGGVHLNISGRNEFVEACMKEKGWQPEHT